MAISSLQHPIHTAAKAAFPYSLPMLTGFVFLGITYGIYMKSLGFNFLYPMLMAATIYAGSVEFIVAGLLIMPFSPVNVFLLALMISGRQLFYGISMLEKYGQLGRKRFFLIFTLVDESFSLNYMAKIPNHIDKGWYMFFVSLYLYLYWVLGSAMGGLLGSAMAEFLSFSLKGVEFAMTALFIVIFAENWMKEQSHESSLLGLGIAITALLVVGKTYFLLPTLIGIWLVLTLRRSRLTSKLQVIE